MDHTTLLIASNGLPANLYLAAFTSNIVCQYCTVQQWGSFRSCSPKGICSPVRGRNRDRARGKRRNRTCSRVRASRLMYLLSHPSPSALLCSATLHSPLFSCFLFLRPHIFSVNLLSSYLSDFSAATNLLITCSVILLQAECDFLMLQFYQCSLYEEFSAFLFSLLTLPFPSHFLT